MGWLLALAAAVLLLVAWGLARWSKKAANEVGLGSLARIQVVYADTGGWEKVEKPLHSEQYRLVGKPDYILRTKQGLVAVEVKPTRRASQPYESDLMQLAAYCLLLEEDWGESPAYGLLRYAENTFRVEWDETLKTELLEVLAEMRDLENYPASLGGELPEPQHDMTSRCQNCGFRYVCWPE